MLYRCVIFQVFKWLNFYLQFILKLAFLNLSADEVVNMIERHPLKDNILSIVMRKYVSLSFTVNGKVY